MLYHYNAHRQIIQILPMCIESTKMMRYARRRGREDEMKKILEEIEDADA